MQWCVLILSLTVIGGSSQVAFLLWGILVFVFMTWTQFKLLWICRCLLVWRALYLSFCFISLQFSVRERRGAYCHCCLYIGSGFFQCIGITEKKEGPADCASFSLDSTPIITLSQESAFFIGLAISAPPITTFLCFRLFWHGDEQTNNCVILYHKHQEAEAVQVFKQTCKGVGACSALRRVVCQGRERKIFWGFRRKRERYF